MLEQFIVEYSSPTLAGIKTANLSCYPYKSGIAVLQEAADLNRRLSAKNICVELLRFSEKRVLLFVYRPDKLQRDLQSPEAQELLRSCGYHTADYKSCIVHLMHRLSESNVFPHEIGLFLGYPVEDVKGFIENAGENYKFSGYWKVYGNMDSAKALFNCYRLCTADYCRHYSCGACIERLAVCC